MSSAEDKLIWLHEDALRADHPLFGEAGDAPACFIWDDAYMARMGYGLKRRVFIYETLLELPVAIYAGPIVATLQKLAHAQIVTGQTPNPVLKGMMDELRAGLKVTTISDDAFVKMDAQPELKRFFKYWNKAKKKAFLCDGRG